MTDSESSDDKDSGKPLATIVITNYNYGRYLQECLDSCFAQTYPHVEVLVIDDGSTDNSRDVIAANPACVAILKDNGGQASAFNSGVENATGDVIFFLDADDRMLPDRVEKTMRVYQEHPDIGWCFHLLRRFEDSTNQTLGTTPIRRSGYLSPSKISRVPPVYLPATSGFSLSSSAASKIFPMPETESISISDKYLGILALSLFSGYLLPEVLAELRIHDSNLYTAKPNHIATGRIAIATSFHLLNKNPTLADYCIFLMVKGLETLGTDITNKYQTLAESFTEQLNLIQRVKFTVLRLMFRSGLFNGG